MGLSAPVSSSGVVHRNHLCVLLDKRYFSAHPPRFFECIDGVYPVVVDEQGVSWQQLEATYPRYPIEENIRESLSAADRCGETRQGEQRQITPTLVRVVNVVGVV